MQIFYGDFPVRYVIIMRVAELGGGGGRGRRSWGGRRGGREGGGAWGEPGWEEVGGVGEEEERAEIYAGMQEITIMVVNT